MHQYLSEADMTGNENTFIFHKIYKDSTVPIQILNDIYQAYSVVSIMKDKDQNNPIYIVVDADIDTVVDYLAKVYSAALSLIDYERSTLISIAIYSLNTKKMLDPIILTNPVVAFMKDKHGDIVFSNYFHN